MNEPRITPVGADPPSVHILRFTELLGCPRVVSLIHPANVRSLAVAKRLGERRSGEWVHRGQSLDLYALDRAEWLATRT